MSLNISGSDPGYLVQVRRFVPAKYKGLAYEDIPLPIGYGQTISQPTTIAIMLEALKVRKRDKVLDVIEKG